MYGIQASVEDGSGIDLVFYFKFLCKSPQPSDLESLREELTVKHGVDVKVKETPNILVGSYLSLYPDAKHGDTVISSPEPQLGWQSYVGCKTRHRERMNV